MEHSLKICVSKKPKPNSLLYCKKVTIRERFLRYLFGEQRKVTIIVPGNDVSDISIRPVEEGGV